MNVHAGIM